MGEMADFYNDQVEEMEYQRGNYRMGLMGDLEAYEQGIIDELGYEAGPYTGRSPELKTCRCCHKTGLHWMMTPKGKWLLTEGNGKAHDCPKNKYKKNFKPGMK